MPSGTSLFVHHVWPDEFYRLAGARAGALGILPKARTYFAGDATRLVATI